MPTPRIALAQRMLYALWNFRGFVVASVRRDFESKYRMSLLGGLWAVLNPLAQIAVFTAVLSGVMRARLPGLEDSFGYSIYLCAGIITWGMFSEIIVRSTSVFVENANLLKKISFPRICLPAAVVLSSAVNFAIVFAIFLAFLASIGRFPGIELAAMIPVLAIHIVLAAGLGVMFGAANVFFRDVSQGVGIGLQFWFWLTPIVYPLSIVPEALKPIIQANPTTALATAYQDILLQNRWPDWGSLVPCAALAIVVAIAAMRFFRRHAPAMVDEL